MESLEELRSIDLSAPALLVGNSSQEEVEHGSEVHVTFCDHAEKVIELLHRSCETQNLAALIPASSRLELSARQVGADGMAFTLGQIICAAQETNPKVVRWLLASLSQEYATVSSTMQEDGRRAPSQYLMT